MLIQLFLSFFLSFVFCDSFYRFVYLFIWHSRQRLNHHFLLPSLVESSHPPATPASRCERGDYDVTIKNSRIDVSIRRVSKIKFKEELFLALILAAQYSSFTIHTELYIKLMIKLMIIKTRVFNPWAATRTSHIRANQGQTWKLFQTAWGTPFYQGTFCYTASSIRKQKSRPHSFIFCNDFLFFNLFDKRSSHKSNSTNKISAASRIFLQKGDV